MSARLNSQTLAEAKAHYDAKGYAIFRQVLDPDLIREASAHLDWLAQQNPHLRPERFGHQLVARDPFWVRLISDDRLLDIAEQFIGPNIALFASHYISKPPLDGQPVLWHQDGSYWPLEPMEVVTLWLAIDDATPENGCMYVIPGSQTMDLQGIQRRTDIDNVLSSEMDVTQIDTSKAVDIVLQAGDVSVHHPHIVHGSNANRSPQRRAGLTMRYIPTSTRVVTQEPWPCLFLLRGEAVSGINAYRSFPKYVPGEHMPFRGCEAWQSYKA